MKRRRSYSVKKIEYSVFSYSPSFVTGERINLGVLVHCAEDNKIVFEHIKKRHYSRLQAFDDELNLDVVTRILDMLESDINDVQLTQNMPLFDNQKTFNLKEYVKHFVNEFSFTEVASVCYENFSEAVDELKKVFLRLYYSKSERPSRAVEQSFVERVINTYKCDYLTKYNTKDSFGLSMKYDFWVNKKYGIKIFNITDRNARMIANNIRAWAWYCEHSNNDTIIVYNKMVSSLKEIEIADKIIDILKSSAKYVVNLEALSNLLSELSVSK